MKFTAKHLSRSALIAALYIAICFIFRPISYGAIQLRISEALTVLPLISPEAAAGLFIGCLVSNLLGGASVALIDTIFGSLTTLLAAILTRKLFKSTKNIFISLLPPVLLNALIVGTYVPFIYTDPTQATTLPIVLFSILTVGIGEAIVVYVLGIPFYKAVSKSKIF